MSYKGHVEQENLNTPIKVHLRPSWTTSYPAGTSPGLLSDHLRTRPSQLGDVKKCLLKTPSPGVVVQYVVFKEHASF